MVDIPQQIPSQVRELGGKEFRAGPRGVSRLYRRRPESDRAQRMRFRPAPRMRWPRPSHLRKTTSTRLSIWRRSFSTPRTCRKFFTLQTEYAKTQLAAIQTQAKELGAAAQEAIASATKK